VLLVLFNHNPPEVWPGAKGEKRTLIEHLLPATSTNPVEQVVEGWKAGPVAGSTLTSVNDHASLPQLVTVALIVVLVPTMRLPNVKASGLIQNLPSAATLAAPRLISNSSKLQMCRTPRGAARAKACRSKARSTRVHYRECAASQLFGQPGIEPPVGRFGMRSRAIRRFRMRSGMGKWSRTISRAVDDGVLFGRIDRISSTGQCSDPAHIPLRLSPKARATRTNRTAGRFS
jgi:hypothetical protein